MNILTKIKKKLKLIVTESLIKASLTLNLPLLSAIAFKQIIGKINFEKEYTVLCLGRSIFTDDVKALAEFSENTNYLVLNLHYWYIIYDYCIPELERAKISEDNYHSHSYGDEGKKKYYIFLSKLLPLLKKKIKFDAILAGNFGYVPQQEIARLCQDKNIPYIVLHKEAFRAFSDPDHHKGLYDNFHFAGHKMLLYNNQIKDLLLSLNISGLTKEKCQVVGIPRLDYYFNLPPKDNKTKQVTFFSYYPQDKFEYLINDKQKQVQAIERSEMYHRDIIQFAINYSDTKVIIKTKVSGYYVNYVKSILNKYFPNHKIPNLTITNAGNTSDYIINSNAVVGFFTTTLVEALIAGKTIISLYFNDLVTDKCWNYFSNYPDLVNYASNYDQLKEFITNYKKYVCQDEKRKKEFLEWLIASADGNASKRVEKQIIELINK